MFETLMLRLTTNVTVSPARSAPELVGGAAHLLDHRRALLGKQRGQLIGRQRVAVAGALDRARREVVGEFELGAPPAAAPRDERPVAALDHVEHRLARPTPVRCTPDIHTGARTVRSRLARAACGPAAATGTGARARYGLRWRSGRRGRSHRRRPAPATSPTGSAAPGSRPRAAVAASLTISRLRSSMRDRTRPLWGVSVRVPCRHPCASTRAPRASAIWAGSRP